MKASLLAVALLGFLLLGTADVRAQTYSPYYGASSSTINVTIRMERALSEDKPNGRIRNKSGLWTSYYRRRSLLFMSSKENFTYENRSPRHHIGIGSSVEKIDW
jgi:hypothetical protein